MPIYLQHDYLLINVGVNMKQSVGYMAKIQLRMNSNGKKVRLQIFLEILLLKVTHKYKAMRENIHKDLYVAIY